MTMKLTPEQTERLHRLAAAYAMETEAERCRKARWVWRHRTLTEQAIAATKLALSGCSAREAQRLLRLARKRPPV